MRGKINKSLGGNLIGKRRVNIARNLNNKNYNSKVAKSNNPLQNLFVGKSAKRMSIFTPEQKAFKVYHKSRAAGQITKKFTKYSRGIGAGVGALAGGGLGYLAVTKALGKKEDFIEKTLRKYPGITKAAAEQIYKNTKRKYLLTGTLGGAVAGGGAGLLIGSRFRNKTTQQPKPQNHPPVQQQSKSVVDELNENLLGIEGKVNEAHNNLDQHKMKVGESIVERHNESAKKVNDAVQRIKDRANQPASNMKNKEKVDNKRGLDEIESLIGKWK